MAHTFLVKIIKIVIFLLAVSLVGFCLLKNIQDFNKELPIENSPTVSEINDIQSVEINGKEYVFAWIQVTRTENLFLHPNFEERYTLQESIEKYGCINLTSGGFYSEANSPIGLFISEAEIISNKDSNNLFNGYFTLTKNGEAAISKDYSGEPVRIGLQAGPILIQNGQIQRLVLANDKMARRIVVALTKEGNIYFITFYNEESVFVGPLLADLPLLVSNIQNKFDIEFISALNLDGGAASAFYNQEIQLSELTPIGSFFCEK